MMIFVLLTLLIPSLVNAAACTESPAGQFNCDKFVSRDSTTSNDVTVQAGSGQTTDLAAFKTSAGTNLVEIDVNGHIRLTGTATAWEDVRIEPVARTSGVNVPTFAQIYTSGAGSRGVYLYRFDNAAVASEKELYFTLQMPHAWAGTAIDLHVHWLTLTTQSPAAVRWCAEYTWAEPLANFGNTTTTCASVVEGGAVGTTANRHEITEFTSLSPTTSQNGPSAILIGRLYRNSSHVNDTFTGNADLLYLDAHYEIDGFGTDTEYTK